MKKILFLMILGRKKRFFDLVRIKGIIYKIDIQPYETAENMIKKAVNAGVFMA